MDGWIPTTTSSPCCNAMKSSSNNSKSKSSSNSKNGLAARRHRCFFKNLPSPILLLLSLLRHSPPPPPPPPHAAPTIVPRRRIIPFPSSLHHWIPLARTHATIAAHELSPAPPPGVHTELPTVTTIPGFPASTAHTVFQHVVDTVKAQQIIEMLLHAKDAAEVELVLDARMEMLLKPNACLLLQILNRLVRRLNPELALQVFEWKKKQFNFHLDSMQCAKLIEFAGCLKNIELAEYFYKQMEVKGLPHTIEVQNALMVVYARNGACWKALTLLQSVLERKDSKTTLDTFNTAVSVYGKLSLVGKMEEVFEALKNSEFQPTTETFNALIWGYRRIGFWQRMGLAFEEMKACGCRPTNFTFSALIRGYAAANLHRKMEYVLAEMGREGYSLSVEDAAAMIFACNKTRNLEMIERILGRVEPKRSHLRIHKLLIKSYAKNNRLEDMEAIVEELLGRKETAVSPRLTLEVAKAYVRQNAYERLDTFLNNARQAGWTFNRFLYNSLVILYSKNGLFQKMEENIKQMLDSGIHPDIEIYKRLQHAYKTCGKEEAASWILDRKKVAATIHVKSACANNQA